MTNSFMRHHSVPYCRIILYSGLFILSILSLTSCKNELKLGPLAAYYSTPDSMGGARVYRYKSTLDSAMSDEFRLLKPGKNGTVQAVIYDESGQPLQWYEEQQTPSGVVMNTLFLRVGMVGNKILSSKANILYDDIFPFDAQLNGIFLYRVKWNGAGGDSLKYELIRNRIYNGDTTIQYHGKKMPAIVFRVRDLIETEQKGILALESKGIEVYGLHTGLVYYQKKINDKTEIAFELEEIISPDSIKNVKFTSPWDSL